MQSFSPNITFTITRIEKVESGVLPTGGIKRGGLPFYELLFTEKGNAQVKTKDYSGALNGMNMILVAPNSFLELTYESETKPILTRIIFDCKNAQLDIFLRSPVFIPTTIQTHLYRALKEYSFIYPQSSKQGEKNAAIPFGAEQLLFYDIEYLFIMLIRRANMKIDYREISKTSSYHISELSRQLTEYIEKHITETITNYELCKEFGINKTTLCKIFKENYNTTLIKYVNLSKIQLAKTLIREGKMNFTQIADYLSYSSIHYFCKSFTRIEGVSPSIYMKMVVHNKKPSDK